MTTSRRFEGTSTSGARMLTVRRVTFFVASCAFVITACSDAAKPDHEAPDASLDDAPGGADVAQETTLPTADSSSEVTPNDAPTAIDIADAKLTEGEVIDAPTMDAGPEDPNCALPAPIILPCGSRVDLPIFPTVDCFRPKHDLLNGIVEPSFLRADAHGVYWVSAGTLMMLPTGQTVPESIASLFDDGNRFNEFYALDEEAFYFFRAGVTGLADIVRMKRDRSETTVLVSGLNTIRQLVVDEDRLYFAGDAAIITFIDKTGGTPVATQAGPIRNTMAIDDLYIYWPYTFTGPPHFYRALKNGGPQESVPQIFGNFDDWSLQGATLLVWSSSASQIVEWRDSNDCQRPLAWPVQGPHFAADDRSIYYWVTTTGAQGLWWMPRSGGAAAQVLAPSDASGIAYVAGIALTPKSVFVLTDSALVSIDRP